MTSISNDAVQQHKKSFVYLISLVACVGGFLFGYDINIISGAVIFMEKEFNLTTTQLAMVMSTAQIGCVIGALVGGKLCDMFGRKKTLIVAAALFGLTTIFTALANDLTTFNIFRFVGGLGIGLASIVSPMYIAEIAPSKIRGRLVTMNQFAICIGLLSSNIVAYFMSFNLGWRWMFASQGVPVVFLVLGLFVIPESPRWLAKKTRRKDALDVLTKINGAEEAEPELVEIEKTIHEESGTIRELFQKGIRMALIIAVCLAFFQQWSGAQPLLLYAPMIFQKAGFTQASDAILQSTILAAWLVLCTTFAFFLVERFGRRQLLIGGALTMMIGMICTSLIFYLQLNPILLLFMMFISIGAYSVSLAPLTWLIMAEIFPNRVRGVAMSIASVVLWVSTVMVNQAFPFLSEISVSIFGSEFGIFIIYAVSCLATALFVWRYLPETRGKTLEEISAFWMKKKKIESNETIQAQQVI
ncbi:MAG: sugar porter family MFS transporter [Chitinophagaceae bacterium]|nr:sugar porter family MFS transporter [Chitinophagaceae bacterium]